MTDVTVAILIMIWTICSQHVAFGVFFFLKKPLSSKHLGSFYYEKVFWFPLIVAVLSFRLFVHLCNKNCIVWNIYPHKHPANSLRLSSRQSALTEDNQQEEHMFSGKNGLNSLKQTTVKMTGDTNQFNVTNLFGSLTAVVLQMNWKWK